MTRRLSFSAATFLVACVAVAAGLLTGCDTSVNPYIGDSRPFTFWGILNSAADTQKVRVFAIEGRSGLDRAGDIDAVVMSTDLTTGETHTWTHREVTYAEGEVGHVFWSPFRPVPGHRYQLAVERSDGARSTARVTVPEGVTIHLDPNSPSTRVPVIVEGDRSRTHIIGTEVVYEASNVPPAQTFPPGTPLYPTVSHDVEISYEGTSEPVAEGWRFFINLARDADIVRSEYERYCLVTTGNPKIALRRVEFRLVAADSAWRPPNGDFDPETLVQPGAFSNVENGFGFLGAGQVINYRWIPPSDVRDLLGYEYGQNCAFIPSDSPGCTDPPVPCFEDNYESIWEIYF